PPSHLRKGIRSGAGHSAEDGTICWRNLEVMGWGAFLDELIGRIPTKRIWITVDKDVLSPQDAVTNWDQGALPLTHLLESVGRLSAKFEIAGADSRGDYPPIRHRNLLKYVEA